jgi:hypothetical protein
MKRPLLIIFFVLSLSRTALAQFEATWRQGTGEPRHYDVLADQENWGFLADPSLREDYMDPIKYIRLRGDDDDWYLSIGGEIRFAWEQVGNDNFGQSKIMNGYWLQRYMIHADTHYGKHFRSFIELKSGLESFRVGGSRPIDEKKLDFLAAFFEVGTEHNKNWVVLRVGRQELNYGSGRVVSVREGPNVRQSFDGIKLRGGIGPWQVDGFAVRPDTDKPGFFDNSPNHQVGFWGIYATRALRHSVSIDLYYLGLSRKNATFNRGTAEELRHTLGVRLWRPISTTKNAWDFDTEGIWQFGTFGSDGIRAWSVASDSGYSFPGKALKPRFELKADVSSGDNPNSHNLGTFNPIFPLGNYFGVIATTGPGPVNFMDLHPSMQLHLSQSVTLTPDWVVQWRESLRDGVYTVPGTLLRAAGNSGGRFVGDRPGAQLRWQIDRHFWLQGDYGVFYAGSFLKDTQPGRNLNYWELWAGYKF